MSPRTVFILALGLLGLSLSGLTADTVFDRHMKVAGERLRAKDYAAAVPSLQAALALEPYSVVAHDALGVAYSQLGQYTLAIQEFKAALQVNPGLALTHNNIGYVYMQMRRLDDAAAEFQQALQIDPENDTAHANLGQVFTMMDRRADAAHSFAAALRRNPKNAEARQGLAQLTAKNPPIAPVALEAPAPVPSDYNIVVSDPTQILRAGTGASYYPVGPADSCLLEVAPSPARTLRLYLWLPSSNAKVSMYWSFVPTRSGPQRAPMTPATPPVTRTVSGVRLTAAGALDLTIPDQTRQCFLSASQPVYFSIRP